MALPPLWPTELPQSVLLAGYSERVADGRLNSGADSGLGVKQAIWVGVVPQTVNLNLTTDQWMRLRRFVRNDTSRGTLPFWVQNPMLHGAIVLDDDGNEMLDDDGNTVTMSSYNLVEFAENGLPTVTESFRHDLHRVSFTLNIIGPFA